MEKVNMKDYLNINFELIDKMTEIKKHWRYKAAETQKKK